MKYVTEHLACSSAKGPPDSKAIQGAKEQLPANYHWKMVQLLPTMVDLEETFIIYFEGEKKSIWPW